MTVKQAEKKGYSPLTFSYAENERGMEKVVADMKRGNIDHVIVDEDNGKSVWRK